jgi:hypothetical protein
MIPSTSWATSRQLFALTRLAIAVAVAVPASAHSQTGASGASEPYVVEYYYKVK